MRLEAWGFEDKKDAKIHSNRSGFKGSGFTENPTAIRWARPRQNARHLARKTWSVGGWRTAQLGGQEET